MTPVNKLVKGLLTAAGATYPVRLAEPDREDTTVITFQAIDWNRDVLLTGISGFESGSYLVTVRGNDGAAVETEARTIQDTLDALAVNHVLASPLNDWVIQSVFTGSISDEDRGELVGDQFKYQYSFTLSLAIGKVA